MIRPPAGGALWAEEASRVGVAAAPRDVVLVETAPGVWEYLTPTGAQVAAGEAVETAPGSGVFAVQPVGADPSLQRLEAIRVSSTVLFY